MKEIDYLFEFEEGNRLRVYAALERGKAHYFRVQYEAFIGGEWTPLVRYDTAHGFAHRDLLHPDGTQEKLPMLVTPYAKAFTAAICDLKRFWTVYRRDYETELRHL
jgi:hypothetical protein